MLFGMLVVWGMDSNHKVPKTVDVYDDRQSNTKGNDDLTNLSKNLKAVFNHKYLLKATVLQVFT